MTDITEDLKSLTPSMLDKYVETRNKVDAEVKVIESLAHTLTRFKHCHSDRMEIDPFALAYVHEVIERSVLDLRDSLESFISINEARRALEKQKP